MPYISQTDQAITLVELGAIENNSSVLKGIITHDRASIAKKDMITGQTYYDGQHDVYKKNYQLFHVKGVAKYNLNAANNHVGVCFPSFLTEQKAEYIAAKPMQLVVKNSDPASDTKPAGPNADFKQKLLDLFGLDFQITLNELIIGASNKGGEVLHVYYDEPGDLDYLVIPAEQFIPDFDPLTQELNSCIRYYKVDYQDPSTQQLSKITKVEVWDKEQVFFYVENPNNGNFFLDATEPDNPRPHWKEYLSTDAENTIESKGWGKVPFIFFWNNYSKVNDLKKIKDLVDAYDKLITKPVNTLEDIQEAIAVIKGYDGTSAEEAYEYMRVFKIVLTTEDGGVDFKDIQIPYEATKAILDIIKENIFLIGKGVDITDKYFAGNVTNVGLKTRFAGLDMKANQMIIQLKKSLRDFMWFICDDIKRNENKDYCPTDVDYTFDKSVIFNEKEIIDSLNVSREIMSEKQMMRKHPYIENVETNMEELDQERAEHSLDLVPVDKYGNPMPKIAKQIGATAEPQLDPNDPAAGMKCPNCSADMKPGKNECLCPDCGCTMPVKAIKKATA